MRWLSKRIWAGLALIVAIGLFYLAQGEIRAGYALGLYQALSVNPFPPEQLNGDPALTARLEKGAATALWSSTYLDQACLNRLVAASANPSDKEELRRAEACFARVLASSPLQACTWTSLAYTRHLLGEAPQKIISPLSISYATGAREGRCMPLRVWTGLRYWGVLSNGDREHISRDIMLLVSNGKFLARLLDIYLEQSAEGKTIIESIVAQDQTLKATFHFALKQRSRATPPAS